MEHRKKQWETTWTLGRRWDLEFQCQVVSERLRYLHVNGLTGFGFPYRVRELVYRDMIPRIMEKENPVAKNMVSQ